MVSFRRCPSDLWPGLLPGMNLLRQHSSHPPFIQPKAMPIQSTTNNDGQSTAAPQRRGYRVTGRAAHGRVARLFQTLLLHEEATTAANDDTTHKLSRWIDTSPYAQQSDNGAADADTDNEPEISFLWENAPRYETKSIRDTVQVYSHLPNGINVLDDKWALARLLMSDGCKNNNHEELLTTLESHCFRGGEEFVTFAKRVGLLSSADKNGETNNGNENSDEQYQFEDLITRSGGNNQHLPPPPPPKNLWVIKDAMSNGAGGIWIVDSCNVYEFINDDDDQQQQSMILHPQHRYIAQQYAWPPTLYNSRKCHVRVYGLLTSDGRAYVHKRAFLHVANEIFEYDSSSSSSSCDGGEVQKMDGVNVGRRRFEPAVHITNCCANSHDIDKFAGEICVELDKPGPFSTPFNDSSGGSGGGGDLPLGDYFPSIAASVAALAEKSAVYVQGGQANNGFEYLGLDFVLSSVPEEQCPSRRKPVAYLLEVNAPPSQDTATGLPHAEELHDEVISDLLRLWVLPNLGIQSASENGWKCVYSPPPSLLDEESSLDVEKTNNLIVPSKAAILNKIRWAMFEKRASKEYESSWRKDEAVDSSRVDTSRREGEDTKRHKCESDKEDSVFDADSLVSFVRSQFPYFSDSTITSSSSAESSLGRNIFLESGGGAQVPRVVVNAMTTSLMNRDRSVVGAKYLTEARKSIASLLVGVDSDEEQERGEDPTVIMGANATSLVGMLAGMYCENGILTRDDEIVIATENHLANVTPWIKAAESVGAKIKWWSVTKCQQHQSKEAMESESSSVLSDLVNEKTRIVAVSNASNILGCVRDISSICSLVHQVTKNQGHVVVDGVATSPHLLSCRGSGMEPDWYVVSLHKLFGPHLGCLIGKRSTALQVAHVEGHLSNDKLCREFEMGTMNYEACAGAIALNEYFQGLGIETWRRYGDVSIVKEGHIIHSHKQTPRIISTQASGDRVEERSCSLSNSALLSIARTCILRVETRLLNLILGYLRKISRVSIIEDVGDMKVTHEDCIPNNSNEQRIPVVSFVHETIPSSEIVEHCRNHGVVCRSCKFLSTDKLWDEMNLSQYDGVVRFSLAHYSSTADIARTIDVLEMLDKWR